MTLDNMNGWQSFEFDVNIEEDMLDYGIITLYLYEADESGAPTREHVETLE